MKNDFEIFDSRQRFTCVTHFLEKEIDFEYYVECGIIEEHYPLHKLQSHKDILKSFEKYFIKL